MPLPISLRAAQAGVVLPSLLGCSGSKLVAPGRSSLTGSRRRTAKPIANSLVGASVAQVHSPLAFLLWMNAALLVAGCMMDIFSAIVIAAPLLLPRVTHFGIRPLHLGIGILANLEIGCLAPPVGIELYLASQRYNRCSRCSV
ncbi:MAG: TRAP transporter large permease subunit [Thiobacillus sp.]